MLKPFFKSCFLLLGVLLIAFPASTQERDIRSILNQREATFDEMVAQADRYFALKYPDLSPYELTVGDNRDGDYVKYQRWKSFWRIRQDGKGKLADYVKHREAAIRQRSPRKSSNPLSAVIWDNSLSHTDYLVSQIGMGRTTSIAFHPIDANIFYVGAANGGIWKTVDGGQSYVPIGDNLPYLSVSSILLDPNNPTTIYAAVSDHLWYGHYGVGIYVSYDDGATWSPTSVNFPLSNLQRVYQLAMDPNDPMTMMAASDAGLLRTTDGWASYSTVSFSPAHDVHYLPGSSSLLVAGGHSGEVLRSTNGGVSFTTVADYGNNYSRLATTELDPNRVVLTVENRLYTSTDAGASYTLTSTQSESNIVVEISQLDVNDIMTGNFEVFLSQDAGNSFTRIMDWEGIGLPQIHVDQRNLFVNPLEPNYIYLANDGGVYRYDLINGVFENLSDGLIITQYYDIAVSQTDVNVISGGSQDNGSLYRNSAGTWIEHAPTGDGMVTEIDPKDKDVIYFEFQFGDIYRNEIGVGLVSISPPGQIGQGDWETPYKLDPTNSDRLVIGYDRVYESFDKGNTWSAISGSLAGGADLNELNIAKANPERIYAAQGGTLYVKNTTDDTWTTRSTPAGLVITDIEIDPCDEDKVYISCGSYISGAKVYMSTDAGATWQNLSDNLPNVVAASIEMYEPASGGIFVGTDTGIFYREDAFSAWQELGMLPHSTVEDIEIQCAADLIRVGTHGRSIWEADLSCLTKSAPDDDNDGVRNCCDNCPGFDNKLCGTPCDDGDPDTIDDLWQQDCTCSGSLPTYCMAEGSPGTGADWISRVTLANLDNSSFQSSYSDFTVLSADLMGNSSYNITVNLNAAFTLDAVYVWIDFNQDYVFDNSELIAMSALNGTVTSSGTIDVPCVEEAYSTRMRVRVIYSDPNFPEPCGSLFGEVEDYTVNLSKKCYGIQISR